MLLITMATSTDLLRAFERLPDADRAARSAKYLKHVFSDALPINSEHLNIFGDTGRPNNTIAPMLSYAYYTAAKNAGLDVNIIFQTPKGRAKEASKEILNTLKKMPAKDTMMVVASDRLGTLNGLGKSYRAYCKSNDLRFTSSSSLGQMTQDKFPDVILAHRYNFKAMKRKQQRLKKRLDATKEVNITTSAGTDLTFSIKDLPAVYNHGIYDKPGMGGNLPAGEIYVPIAKRTGDGTLVIDGSSRQKDKTLLCEHPITLTIKDGVVREISGKKEANGLEKTFKWAENRAKHPWGIRMISEIGIGLNDKAKIIGATIIDEKAAGTAHIALGSNHWFGGQIHAITHLDQVFRNPKIRLDGKRLNI